MGQAANSIIEASLVYRVFGQTCMNVFHYVVTVPSSVADPIQEAEDFLAGWWDGGNSNFIADWLAITPGEARLQTITAQFILPTRYRRAFVQTDTPGLGAEAFQANIQATIVSYTTKAGKPYRGAKRLLMPSNQADAGILTTAYKTLLINFADEMKGIVVGPGGAGIYAPCIFHRSANIQPRFDIINDTLVQDTARVIRRRTVGVGN